MGRPAKFDREKAVEIAMNEIWEHGYEACSVKALSEKLGITRSSFYNAFESREALFDEVIALYASQSPDHVLEEAGVGDRILPMITNLFREVCRVRTTERIGQGCMVVNSVTELVGQDEVVGPRLEEALKARIDTLQQLLGQAADQGELNSRRGLREKALALQNLLLGINVLSKVIHSEEELWAVAKTTLIGLELYKNGQGDSSE
jgi:TetR/AcrR family transcriptional repressor of nem operon